MKILNDEPPREGQICGYQIAYGMPGMEFCGERKAPGLYFCQEHHDAVMDEYGVVRMAQGNAIGGADERPPLVRPVPYESGEGAIYSPDYLIQREGNAYGSAPEDWRTFAR
ncbi:hypothetical protein AS594_07005 [Streptomyces agglomeratus]|uniref:Uncharacterized protein n=1 Tax=Streptomyces agglomeratus TaxID=285458 RepID=A0A1E5P3Z3_9ACTN|nr:hypothetical protein [Streptomyces agglomeratus]OEJ24270.1 hypothetical protein AS594_07005 [Streptomyces agglomeratus]